MHNYLRLLAYARRYRQSLLRIFAVTLAASGLVALQPWPIKLLIDHVLEAKPLPTVLENIFHALSLEPTRWTLLSTVVGGGLVLFARSSAADAGLSWVWTVVGRRMVYDVAEYLFARLQRRSLTFHKRTPVGDLMGRVIVDSW